MDTRYKTPSRLAVPVFSGLMLLTGCGEKPNEPYINGPGTLPGTWTDVSYKSPGWSHTYVFEKSGAFRSSQGSLEKENDTLFGKWELRDGDLSITLDSCTDLADPPRRTRTGCSLGYDVPEWDPLEKMPFVYNGKAHRFLEFHRKPE